MYIKMKILGVSNPSIMYPKACGNVTMLLSEGKKKRKKGKKQQKKTNTILMPFLYRINK